MFVMLVIKNGVEVAWPGQDIVERTGDLLLLAALVYVAYEYRKHARLRPDRRGLTDCVEFYRAQLVHERDLARQSVRYLLPFVPGIALSLLGGIVGTELPLGRRIAVVVSGVMLFLGIAWLNAHTTRKLQKAVDAIAGL
jgi:hypothetical protein